MSFRDEEIRALVGTGKLTDPGAAEELARLIIERRDMIGRYWFARVNPLDHFRVAAGGLYFTDLAVEGGLERAEATEYRFQRLDAEDKAHGAAHISAATEIAHDGLATGAFHGVNVSTRRHGGDWSLATRVRFYLHEDGRYQLVGVERES